MDPLCALRRWCRVNPARHPALLPQRTHCSVDVCVGAGAVAGELKVLVLWAGGGSGFRSVGVLEALGPPGFLILFIDLPSVDGCICPVKHQEERTRRVLLGLGCDLVIVPV